MILRAIAQPCDHIVDHDHSDVEHASACKCPHEQYGEVDLKRDSAGPQTSGVSFFATTEHDNFPGSTHEARAFLFSLERHRNGSSVPALCRQNE